MYNPDASQILDEESKDVTTRMTIIEAVMPANLNLSHGNQTPEAKANLQSEVPRVIDGKSTANAQKQSRIIKGNERINFNRNKRDDGKIDIKNLTPSLGAF